MKRIIPIASGKGGVGKSVFTVNFAISLAKMGKTVIIVDLDLGGSNLHTLMGIKNQGQGLGSFINKKESNIESLIQSTDIEKLYFIAGDGLYTGTANLHYFQKIKIMKELNSLVADFILLDLGAGSSYNILDFYVMSPIGFLLMVPETTSILNGYGFIKSVLFRKLYLGFPPKSKEREYIQEMMKEQIEGISTDIPTLLEPLCIESDSIAKQVDDILNSINPKIIINRVKREEELQISINLRKIARKKLGIEVEYFGYLPEDENIQLSINKRKPFILTYPNSQLSNSINNITSKSISIPINYQPAIFQEDEDFKLMLKK